MSVLQFGNEVLLAVTAASIFQIILQLEAASCAVPFTEGVRLGLFTGTAYEVVEKKIVVEMIAGQTSSEHFIDDFRISLLRRSPQSWKQKIYLASSSFFSFPVNKSNLHDKR